MDRKTYNSVMQAAGARFKLIFLRNFVFDLGPFIRLCFGKKNPDGSGWCSSFIRHNMTSKCYVYVNDFMASRPG